MNFTTTTTREFAVTTASGKTYYVLADDRECAEKKISALGEVIGAVRDSGEVEVRRRDVSALSNLR